MYWLARSVMQADGFGTLLDACLLALCLILIAVKIMNPRGEAGTPIAIGRRPEWAAPPHNCVMVEALGITVPYCAARCADEVIEEAGGTEERKIAALQ
jgi:hypothetical protein